MVYRLCLAGLVCTVVAAAQPHVGSGLSTPKEAARTWAQAMYDGDLPVLKKCVLEGDGHVRLADGLSGVMLSMRKATEALLKRFESEMKSLDTRAIDPRQIDPKAIDEGQVVLDGDRATIRLAGRKGETIPLRRVGTEWRVDMIGFFKLDAPGADRPLEASIEAADGMFRATKEEVMKVAEEIDGGRFTSAKEAMTAVVARMRRAQQEEAQGQADAATKR